MKALSVRQPWVWCILSAGKDIENRSWQATNPGMRFRGTCLLHASAGMTHGEYESCRDYVERMSDARTIRAVEMPEFDKLERGGIVGIMEIADVVSSSLSPWWMGPVGLCLVNVRPLPFIPFKGALGFFDVSDSVLAGVHIPAAG